MLRDGQRAGTRVSESERKERERERGRGEERWCRAGMQTSSEAEADPVTQCGSAGLVCVCVFLVVKREGEKRVWV